ncbi:MULTISPECIES: aldo/keto reductase [Streptomyces]|uniref:aldo/keto reductase n=1 Tax=Streptomyces TaxID=1883 RepID=UPI000BF1A6A4|nr:MULTISPECIES: aldo/keto reductase [unclassified Streptomyces]WTE27268.1 aldo/keto reductase [Streptomyces anulatus]
MRTTHPRLVLGLHRSRHERSLLTAAADLGITTIDTSTNYLGFHSHQVLAEAASDLLPKFTVSTKVGYFPAGSTSEHSLAPGRLHTALEQAARDLRREPDLVFLHNPEHSLADGSRTQRQDRLEAACSVLVDATAAGLCGSWGISSWDPRPLTELARHPLPRPAVLMVRAGLFVGAEILNASETLVSRWQPSALWGMSPFGGSTTEPIWKRFDPRIFMGTGQDCSPGQAAFRAAFHLPEVDAVAAGTSKTEHLEELINSLAREVNVAAITQYRQLLARNDQTG